MFLQRSNSVPDDYKKSVYYSIQKNMVTKLKKIITTTIDGICFDYGTVNKILFFVNKIFFQGHPKTVFCKIAVRRSKFCAEFSLLEDG